MTTKAKENVSNNAKLKTAMKQQSTKLAITHLIVLIAAVSIVLIVNKDNQFLMCVMIVLKDTMLFSHNALKNAQTISTKTANNVLDVAKTA